MKAGAPMRVYFTPDQIREWRARHNVSQSQLASLLHLSVLTVKRWEKGSRPIMPMAAMLLQERRFRVEARALGGLPYHQPHDWRPPGEGQQGPRSYIPTRASPPQQGPRG